MRGSVQSGGLAPPLWGRGPAAGPCRASHAGRSRESRASPPQRGATSELLASSFSTASPATAGMLGCSPRTGSRTTGTCLRPISSGTDHRRTSLPGRSTRTSTRSSRLSGRSRPTGSGTRSGAGSPSSSPRGGRSWCGDSSCSTLRSTYPAQVALFAAENARAERTYVSFDEAVERRYDESQLHGAPRSARGGGAPRPPRARRRRPLALPLLPGRRRGCLRRDGLRAAAVRRRARADAPRARVAELPPLRPPARRAPRRSRQPAHRGDGERRSHRALGRARRDRGRDHRAFSASEPIAGAGESRGRPTGEGARRAEAGSEGVRPRACQTQCSSAMASASSRIATPSSASSRVIVSGGTTMTTFQWVIR